MLKLYRRIRTLIARDRLDHELDEEIEQHVERLTGQLRDQGFDEDEARKRALQEFGAVHRVREDAREARGLRVLEELIRDLRFGVRMLRKRPAFTLVAILSLAIGIGANTTIFSVVNSILLKELPYERADELVDIHLQLQDMLFVALSYPDFDDLRDGTRDVFSGMAGSQLTLADVDNVSEERGLFGEAVTGDYFSVLGIEPVLGRAIGPADDRDPGAHPVAMLSYAFWQSSFGGDPDVIGRELRIEGRAYEIIGVASPEYRGIVRGLLRPAFFVPMMMIGELSPGDLLNARDNHNLFGKARLAPGVSLAQAEATVAAVSADLSVSRPVGWDPTGAFSLVPTTEVVLSPELDTRIWSVAWLLMAVVGLILLVVCVNLAGFLLARALDRRRDIAVRLALGASRFVLVRQLLVETTLLSLVGGAVGFFAAVWILRVVPGLDVGLGITLNPDLAPDSTVLLFSLGVSILAGVVLGLVPALQSTRASVASTLKSDSTAVGQPGRQRWRNALVITQLTVSLVILVGAGLFLRSLEQQRGTDPGFGQSPAAVMTVQVPAARFSPDAGRVYTRELLDRFRALPGVESVGMAHTLPLAGGFQWIDFLVDGHQPADGQEVFHADYAIVDPGFFAAAGIQLMRGRPFQETDRQGGQEVVIVSEEMARRFWPDGSAIGQVVRMSGGSPALPGGAADMLVVGVAGDIAWESLNESPRLMVYVPYAQFYSSLVTFIASVSGDADLTAVAMRTAATDMDPELSVLDATTMARHVSTQLRPTQVVAGMLSGFAILVLLLAAIGLYGIVSYAVATRTREVGIRMALGADSSAVRRLLTMSGARLVAIGVAIGLLLAFPVNGLLSNMLFGVESVEPAAFAGASLVLGAIALLAAYLPARRASKVNPVVALRTE